MKLLIQIALLSLAFTAPASIDRLSASITTRQAQQGKSVTIRGDVFYQRNGNMVTHFNFPRDIVILANKLGESALYLW